jgi:RIO-like serine/threonine protein kinase
MTKIKKSKTKTCKKKRKTCKKKSRTCKKRTKLVKKRGTKLSRKGGTILGSGKDGCIIDSLSCGKFSRENGYVAKIFKKGIVINKEINNKLAQIDPDNKRFNRYYFPLDNECIQDVKTNPDVLACFNKNGELNDTTVVVFQKYLTQMTPKNMTKPQYRYLRESLEILKRNGISHGDLPNNVMLDPNDNLPRIIDWENAIFSVNESDFIIDWNAFLFHYGVPSLPNTALYNNNL